jgi:hypothetical protein
MSKLLPVALALLAVAPALAAEFEIGSMPPPPPAPHATIARKLPGDDTPQQRRIDLVLRTQEWRARKDAMRECLDNLVATRIKKEGHDAEWRKMGVQIWDLLESVERQQGTVADRLMARIDAEEKNPAARENRKSAVRTVRDFRKFTIYGNMAPRIIDEAVENAQGLYAGRFDAGPRWGIAMTFEEAQAVNRSLIELTGISSDDYHAVEDAVHKEDEAAHPPLHP